MLKDWLVTKKYLKTDRLFFPISGRVLVVAKSAAFFQGYAGLSPPYGFKALFSKRQRIAIPYRSPNSEKEVHSRVISQNG